MHSTLCEITAGMVIVMSIKTYSELSLIPAFEERFSYLQLGGLIGEETFGFDRYLNQVFYRSQRWKSVRDFVILRDNGCDLGVDGYEIHGRILIHHMNPITIEDIERESEFLLDPEFLIATSHNTHNAIHYGDESLLIGQPIIRTPNDTCPWRQ